MATSSDSHTLPQAAAAGFANASAYDKHRPSYPPEALTSFLKHLRLQGAGPGTHVVEIAAGTGKFTELLAARQEDAFEILAVEPHEGMREQLVKKGLRGVTVEDGFAAAMPKVVDGWGDACIAAQSFHWFATSESLNEMHRVLKPGAVFGLIWNIEDYNKPRSWTASTSWEKKLNDWIFSISHDGLPRFRDEAWRKVFEQQTEQTPHGALKDTVVAAIASPSHEPRNPLFSLPLGEETVRWTVWLSPEDLWKRIGTLSQVAVLEGQARLDGENLFQEALAMSDVERNEKGEVALHGVTYFAWTDRL